MVSPENSSDSPYTYQNASISTGSSTGSSISTSFTDRPKSQTSTLHSLSPDVQESLFQQILNARSLYQVLSLSPDCSSEEVRKNYLKLSRHVHPDKCNHPLAHDAFHRLKTAYETLNRSNSRRMYDLRGEDYFKDDFSLGFDGLGQKWKTCINEVFREFANANYEPVLAVVDLINHNNPNLMVSRQSVQSCLDSLHILYKDGVLRYDLIKPELQQLHGLYLENKSLSIFNVLGRSRYSLQTTRLMLMMLKKTWTDGSDTDPTMDPNHYAEPETMTLGSRRKQLERSKTLQLLEAMIDALSMCDNEAARLGQWIGYGSRFFTSFLSPSLNANK